MTTHERELTEPVDLCTLDGLALNDDARGWSRKPLHRANLAGFFGTNKRWDYWAILAGDLVISTTIADIDHLGLADVYWADIDTGVIGGQSVVVGADAGIRLPERMGSVPLVVDEGSFHLRIEGGEGSARIEATWMESDGRPGWLEAFIEMPLGHESLNVVIPWHDELFNYTSKHQARPASGVLCVGDERREFGLPNGAESWGVLDVGRGRWPARINWNWGGGAGRSDGHVIGLQFGAQWTAGSGFTENCVIVDGRISKIGRELEWSYDWDAPMKPWHVVDPGGQLDVRLRTRFDRHSLVEVSDDLGSEVHQVFGAWSGELTTDDGLTLRFDDLQGFAEEARQRW